MQIVLIRLMNVLFARLDVEFNKMFATARPVRMPRLYAQKMEAIEYVMTCIQEMNGEYINGCMVLTRWTDDEVVLLGEMILEQTKVKYNINMKGM